MKLVEVKTKREAEEFTSFPVRLYARESNWIRPLDKDVEAVFDPDLNKNFENGECIRWILRKEGTIIGRVAAFINRKSLHKENEQPTGGMGFFECVNDQEAANALMEACKKWLEERGMAAMDGPVNFGDRDKWWGLLVKGFDLEPNYLCNYHFPYYKELFENFGFREYFRQFTFRRNVFAPVHPRIQAKSAIVNQDPGYTFEHLKLNRYKKYVSDITSIYNRAWSNHEGVAAITEAQVESIIKKVKSIIDEKIIWFAYYKQEPVAFYINLPEINQVFKYVNGKLDLPGKLKFLWHKWRKTNRKMLGLVFGVVPEHQRKGVDGGIITAFCQMVQKEYPRYDILEINGIGDFNPKMIVVMKQVGGETCKIHATYRYLFDRSQPFERMKDIR
ncbi:hypothetical protein EDD80_10927 [Anseongella ginsenosidimutans]|uniref:N-acetyltransferase domain-containing protein n=1 Tax=Anseongella ginsenosidimutans TaxID=496056 RepID=A0A4R3KP97_9SPHI|nr:hypothetical protein [Anseongella ginsenosidimutans]QEC53742.1 hypothetical protein FRZ59_16290 [Anseongella ginsenosidimutans]TCS86002.1 hypothetical protein EDD80_10927 [Anseongella ginsenosidimutans]